MVSVHPWTQWAQTQLPALARDTGIKVKWEILHPQQRGTNICNIFKIPTRQNGSPYQ